MNFNHKLLIIVFGIVPTTLWFAFGLLVAINFWNNITNYFIWTLFIIMSLLGVLGLWWTVLKEIKQYKYKLINICMLLSGITSMSIIYFSDPSKFKKLEITLVAPIIIATSIVIK
ncbi:MAG: hypothetical protein IMY67_09615, partial [Bacteroidetes bacterium]|nr:hypothetical protein [Bacteroidota bacterium]